MNDVQAEIHTPLSERERQLKLSLETEIERNMEGFKRVGYALMIIRDQRLYRQDYDSFDDYLAEEWDLGRSRAGQLIDCHKVVENLSTIVDRHGEPLQLLPANERQARPLVYLPEDVQKEVWELVVETVNSGDGKITANLVFQCAETIRHGKITEFINKAKHATGKRGGNGGAFPHKIQETFQSFIGIIQEEADNNWKEVGRRDLAKMLRELLKTLEG